METVTVDPDAVERGTLYWFRVTANDLGDGDPNVHYRPRRVEDIEDDRIVFDTGYYALTEDAAGHSGSRFKVTDNGFTYGDVLEFYPSNVLPGAVLEVTANGRTREVRVADTLYGYGERYYVRDEVTDSLYYLNGTTGELRRAAHRDTVHDVTSVELVENGDNSKPMDEAVNLDRVDLLRQNRGGDVDVVYPNEYSFRVARDGVVGDYDYSPVAETVDGMLDGRYTVRKGSTQVMVQKDPETDEVLGVLPKDEHLKPSVDPEEATEEIREELYGIGLNEPRYPFGG